MAKGKRPSPQTAANPGGGGTTKALDKLKDKPIIVEELSRYEHKFTPDELNDIGLWLSTAISDKENLDNDKKSLVSEFNSKIEAQNAIITNLKNLRLAGMEQRKAMYKVVKDFEKGTKQFYLLPGGELVKECKIEQTDYTIHFPANKISPEEEAELTR